MTIKLLSIKKSLCFFFSTKSNSKLGFTLLVVIMYIKMFFRYKAFHKQNVNFHTDKCFLSAMLSCKINTLLVC